MSEILYSESTLPSGVYLRLQPTIGLRLYEGGLARTHQIPSWFKPNISHHITYPTHEPLPTTKIQLPTRWIL